MYLHCCHLLPLCRWCYCCGSLLLMFISYKCHTQSADIAGPNTSYQLLPNRPTTDHLCVVFCATYSNMVDIFCTIGYFIKFFQLHKSHREYDSFFMKYFLSAKSSQAVIWEWTVCQVAGLAEWQYGARSCFPYGGHAVLSINCKRVLHSLAIAGPSDMEVLSGLLKCRRAYE